MTRWFLGSREKEPAPQRPGGALRESVLAEGQQPGQFEPGAPERPGVVDQGCGFLDGQAG